MLYRALWFARRNTAAVLLLCLSGFVVSIACSDWWDYWLPGWLRPGPNPGRWILPKTPRIRGTSPGG